MKKQIIIALATLIALPAVSQENGIYVNALIML